MKKKDLVKIGFYLLLLLVPIGMLVASEGFLSALLFVGLIILVSIGVQLVIKLGMYLIDKFVKD